MHYEEKLAQTKCNFRDLALCEKNRAAAIIRE
ncbi:MAG: hypothetical protein JWN60_1208 [Acidobacteria bacterium]|jgi:hypothetical protein|nr:hypothetical protein [Acidobacteriota bacterium]